MGEVASTLDTGSLCRQPNRCKRQYELSAVAVIDSFNFFMACSTLSRFLHQDGLFYPLHPTTPSELSSVKYGRYCSFPYFCSLDISRRIFVEGAVSSDVLQ